MFVALTLTTHLLDILLWAVTFNGMDLVSPVRNAIHFAALTYTTLGAPTSLPEQWLLLEAACCVAGMLTFAWTSVPGVKSGQSFFISSSIFRYSERAS